MKKLILLPALLCLISACSRKEEKDGHLQADALYEELLKTYKAYADSITRISPSDTTGMAQALEDRFESRIKDIYWRYPADLDYSMSEIQNDTLWHYVDLYIKARKRHGCVEYADTLAVPSDSVPEV